MAGVLRAGFTAVHAGPLTQLANERDHVHLGRAVHDHVVATAVDRVAGADDNRSRLAGVAGHVEPADDPGPEHIAVGEPALADDVVGDGLQVVLGQQHPAEELGSYEGRAASWCARTSTAAAAARTAAPATAAAAGGGLLPRGGGGRICTGEGHPFPPRSST